MKQKKGFYLLLKILVSVVIALLTTLLINQFLASNLPYGKKANNLRISLAIPSIKSSMYSNRISRKTIGNSWENFWSNPKEGEVIHIWKISIPKDDNKTLFEERDGFRKMLQNGILYQLNIITKIENNKVIEKYGTLFQVRSSNELYKEFSGSKLDSIIFDWRILELN